MLCRVSIIVCLKQLLYKYQSRYRYLRPVLMILQKLLSMYVALLDKVYTYVRRWRLLAPTASFEFSTVSTHTYLYLHIILIHIRRVEADKRSRGDYRQIFQRSGLARLSVVVNNARHRRLCHYLRVCAAARFIAP